MARIRTIKPEFWTDEDIAMLSEPARLLAIGLLNHADDEGYFKAHPMLVKAAVFPITDPSVSIQDLIIELSKSNYILLSTGIDGKQYGFIRGFKKHQRVNRPNESKIKDLVSFNEISVIDHEQINDSSVTEQGTGNREQGKEQGKGKDKLSTSQAKADDRKQVIKTIFDYWVSVMGKDDRVNLTQKRRSAINARLNDGFTPREICQAIKGCSMTPFNMGDNDRQKPFNDIELICRDDTKLMGFIETSKSSARPWSAATQATIDALNSMEFD